MTASQLRLMLVDEDPVFRLGLRIWLEQTAGHQVVIEASQADEALAALEAYLNLDQQQTWSDVDQEPLVHESAGPALDLVILDLGLGAGDPSHIPGLQLCRDIKTRYPGLPVLVLSAQTAPVLEAVAQQMGADKFALRSLPVRELGQLIQQLSRKNASIAINDVSDDWLNPLDFEPPAPSPVLPGLLAIRRQKMRYSAVQQIEAVMATIEAERRRGRSDLLTEAVLSGRYRELKAARWLIKRLLATPALSEPAADNSGLAAGPDQAGLRSPYSDKSGAGGTSSSVATDGWSRLQKKGAVAPLAMSQLERIALQQGDLATIIFERVFRKLQGNLANTSDIALELDILRDDKKRELLFLTLRKIEDALDSIRRAAIPPGQLSEKAALVLQDIWTEVITDFFGRYYTLQVDNLEQPVVPALMVERPVVAAAILNKIPAVPMLMGYLLYKEPLVIDGSAYTASTPEAMERSQMLLENLLIQLTNAVMQPLLNQFGDVELLKKSLYQRRMMTSRDIARFRNELSWQYRWDQLVNEPKAIFESQYRLLGFTERGIQSKFIYAPRRDELEELSGLQRTVTLAVEARDAIAPRFRSLVGLVGSGVVYVLTDVIGRGIGLIGRGILRGVGSAWNDPRYREKSKDESH